MTEEMLNIVEKIDKRIERENLRLAKENYAEHERKNGRNPNRKMHTILKVIT